MPRETASAGPSRRVDVVALDDVGARAQAATVAEEIPIAFEVGGIAHAVLLATPLDLEDLALGFLLSEGLIETRAELLDVVADGVEGGIALRLTLTRRAQHRFRERRRVLAGRTGCGLCGIDSIAAAMRPLPRVWPTTVGAAALARGMRELAAAQALQRATGATHAAGWLDLDGRLALVREDVGRHNALDKLLGAMSRRGVDPALGFVAVTSRASYEMVAKAASAHVGVLAAISAPTALAVRVAQEVGMTLAGFVRGSRATLYARGDGVVLAPGDGVAHARRDDVMDGRRDDVMEDRSDDVMDARSDVVVDAPRDVVVDAPRDEVVDAPGDDGVRGREDEHACDDVDGHPHDGVDVACFGRAAAPVSRAARARSGADSRG